MKEIWKNIGEHLVLFICMDDKSVAYLDKMFGDRPDPALTGTEDFYQIYIRQGGHRNAAGADTVTSRDERGNWHFERPDYKLSISADYRQANMQFYDYIGLRSVMMNWYSSIIARLRWGLIVHSSCVIHDGEGRLFAGVSGAGKTTVACLSYPKKLMSDEATIVKLTEDEPATVFDSPMRSSLLIPSPVPSVPLRAIYLLKQSPEIRSTRIPPAEALLSLFNKIWYWPHLREDAAHVVHMCKRLVESVPVYELEFQKNDLFWEAIS